MPYNTLVVLGGVALLGAAAGPIGALAVLRRRALVGDALAHATLPGLCVAFLLVGERSLPALLLGALVSGLLGVGVLAWLGKATRIKEDAALGVVLSVFFGLGVVLAGILQKRPGNKAGLDTFIFGKAAGLQWLDLMLLVALAVVCLGLVIALFKEFQTLGFDRDFAAAQGWPVARLDLLLLALIAVLVVVGLPAVGVVLVAAMLITPAATARLWTQRLDRLLLLSSLVGALTGALGAWLSSWVPHAPTGAVIVLVGAALFLLSACVRGAAWR
ncbi:MAG: metal ABC transporter permease [Phycisphaerales bacterium]|jgi:manganese/zinc/iron transport system permease protein|nr:metal ABC transporter permease [Phycisphaerales bacterium]